MDKPADEEKRNISLGDDFGPVVVNVSGVTLVIDANGTPTLKTAGDATVIANGNIAAYSTDGDVTAHTNGVVQLKLPAPEQADVLDRVTRQAYNIGDKLPDGWIVGPVSPDTGVVMALEPTEGALDGYQTWHKGEHRAKDLRDKGNENARQPLDSELNVIYKYVVRADRNANARLITRDSLPYGVYWSATTSLSNQFEARVQYLYDGERYGYPKDSCLARVRCVRDEPGLTLAS